LTHNQGADAPSPCRPADAAVPLLRRLQADLASMREESVATATMEPKAAAKPLTYENDDSEVGR
jgi:hypothetical protein